MKKATLTLTQLINDFADQQEEKVYGKKLSKKQYKADLKIGLSVGAITEDELRQAHKLLSNKK